MGTDIYAWVEAKDQKGKWFTINPRFVDLNDMSRISPVREYEIRRSYLLFSALANVRNSWGLPFIQENRGIPKDISKETHEAVKEWLGSGYAYGYITPKELELYAFEHQDSEYEKLREAAERIHNLYLELHELSLEIIGQRTGDHLSVNDMRIVFWFDS